MKKLLSIALCFTLISLCFTSHISAKSENESVKVADAGYVNVEDFGAVGTDKKDDYEAFEAALATGKNIYVPKGNFYLSRTVVLSDRILRGSSPNKTILYGIAPVKDMPVILMEGCSSLSDVVVGYKTEDESLGSVQGEKVAVQIGSSEKPLTQGSVLTGLYIINSGTGFYSPADAGCNGVIFENIEINQYTYRGFDMQSQNRMMNIYSNCYITSLLAGDHETKTSCGFAMEGSSFGETFNQINVEHDEYVNCIVLKNAKGFNFSSIHLEGICLQNPDSGYVYLENSSGHISSICTLYSRVVQNNNHLFYFGNSSSEDVLTIGVLQNRGFNQFDVATHPLWEEYRVAKGYGRGLLDGSPEAADFRIFGRADNATGKYSVKVDYNSYFSFASDDIEFYRTFDNVDNLSIEIKSE